MVKLSQSKSFYDADSLGNQALVFCNGSIYFFKRANNMHCSLLVMTEVLFTKKIQILTFNNPHQNAGGKHYLLTACISD